MELDQFIKKQRKGRLTDVGSDFTIDPKLSRKKLLSTPPVCDPLDTVNLLQRALIEELRHPFGPESPVSTLAKAIFRLTLLDIVVCLFWGHSAYNPFKYMFPKLQLNKKNLLIPDDLQGTKTQGLHVLLGCEKVIPPSQCKDHLCEHVYRLIRPGEEHSPMSSFSKNSSEFFAERTRPFVALRTYASHSAELVKTEQFKIEIKEQFYENIDPRTLLIKKLPKRFDHALHGTLSPPAPTIVHHHLDSDLTCAPHSYHATFLVTSSDRPAHVHLISDYGVSPAIRIEGPPGLYGLAIWPGLKRDIWGTRVIKDGNYERALEWIDEQVQSTSAVLNSRRPEIFHRLEASDLIDRAKKNELFEKMEQQWTDP